MAFITRVYVTSSLLKMPTKPEVSPWPQSPSQHLCVGSGQGGSRAVVESFPENFFSLFIDR